MAAWDKTRMREEKVARLEALGWSDIDIAANVGLSPAGLAQLKIRPSYREIIARVKDGVIGEYDALLDMDYKQLREEVKANVPIALQAIFDTIQQTKDAKLRLSAAESLLAIDGRFAKVSRTGAALPEQGGDGFEEDSDIVKTILRNQKAKAVTLDSPPATEITQ